jgi:hypothetical protein
MSGGAFKNSSNLLGRKREIEELEAATQRSLRKTELAEKELEAARMLLEKAGLEIEELRAGEQELLLKKNTRKMALKRLYEKQEELTGSVQELSDERGRLKQQTTEISDSRQELDTDLSGLEERRSGMEAEITSLAGKLEEEKKRREALDKDLSDAKLLSGTASQRAGFINENINRLKEELKKLSEEEKALRGGTEDTTVRIAEKEEEICQAETQVQEGKEKAEARRYNERYDQSTNQTSDREGYYGNQDYQIGGGSYNDRTETRQNSTSAYAATLGTSIISISELTYMDSDGDGSITKGESIEVESFVTNTTNSVLRDVVISLNVSDSKACSFSPSLTTTLQPGQKIRYTGRIHCNRRPRGNTSIGVNLSTLYSGKTCSSNNLYVKVR